MTSRTLPPEYQHKKYGRIVAGITVDTGDFDNRGLRLYEDHYKTIRTALQDVKQSVQGGLGKMSAYYNGAPLDDITKNQVQTALAQHGIALDSEGTKAVLKDWQLNSPNFSQSYEPEYLVDIGRPVLAEYYNNIAQKVDGFREQNPQYASSLDRMILGDASGESMLYPDRWCKQNPDSAPQNVRDFSRAVRSGFSSLDVTAARAYIRQVPSSEDCSPI